jgi:hypothetical protein
MATAAEWRPERLLGLELCGGTPSPRSAGCTGLVCPSSLRCHSAGRRRRAPAPSCLRRALRVPSNLGRPSPRWLSGHTPRFARGLAALSAGHPCPTYVVNGPTRLIRIHGVVPGGGIGKSASNDGLAGGGTLKSSIGFRGFSADGSRSTRLLDQGTNRDQSITEWLNRRRR